MVEPQPECCTLFDNAYESDTGVYIDPTKSAYTDALLCLKMVGCQNVVEGCTDDDCEKYDIYNNLEGECLSHAVHEECRTSCGKWPHNGAPPMIPIDENGAPDESKGDCACWDIIPVEENGLGMKPIYKVDSPMCAEGTEGWIRYRGDRSNKDPLLRLPYYDWWQCWFQGKFGPQQRVPSSAFCANAEIKRWARAYTGWHGDTSVGTTIEGACGAGRSTCFAFHSLTAAFRQPRKNSTLPTRPPTVPNHSSPFCSHMCMVAHTCSWSLSEHCYSIYGTTFYPPLRGDRQIKAYNSPCTAEEKQLEQDDIDADLIPRHDCPPGGIPLYCSTVMVEVLNVDPDSEFFDDIELLPVGINVDPSSGTTKYENIDCRVDEFACSPTVSGVDRQGGGVKLAMALVVLVHVLAGGLSVLI